MRLSSPLLVLVLLGAVACEDGCTCRTDASLSRADLTEPNGPESNAAESNAAESNAAEPSAESGEESARVEAGSEGDSTATRTLALECDRGLTHACVSLGAAWEAGQGVRASEAEARRIYRAACRRAGEGCLDAARVHPDQAGPYYERGCQAGLAEACRRWADAMPTKAVEARARGCQLGWWDACTETVEGCGGTLARCLERARELRETRPAEARRLASMTCRDDTVGGCALYAELLHETDPLAAQVAYEWGCTAGDLTSCRTLLDGRFELDPGTRFRAEQRIATLSRANAE